MDREFSWHNDRSRERFVTMDCAKRYFDLKRLDPGDTMRFTVEPVIEEPEGTGPLGKKNQTLLPKLLATQKRPGNSAEKVDSLCEAPEKRPLLSENNNDEISSEKPTNGFENKNGQHPLLRTLSLPEAQTARAASTNLLVTSGKGDSVDFADNTTCREILDTDYIKSMQETGKRFGRHKQKAKERLVSKGGDINLTHVNFDSKGKNFFIDIFTTLVDMKWRYNILMFAVAFLGTWLLFGIGWYIILLIHKDHQHVDDPEWTPCMAEVYDFTTAILFSLETQHTIGYGSRSMHPKCPPAILLLMLQSCVGVFVQSLVTGVIFAKLARPKRRSHTIIFSEHAVICLRDNEYCLLFRVGDMRSQSLIINANVRAILFKNRTTQESEDIPLCQYPVEVETETSLVDSYTFMATPVTVLHKINEKSPFWNLSGMEDLVKQNFEMVVILEGTIESTGMTTQLRTSYIPTEIKWGYFLEPLVTCKKDKGYEIDHGMFHKCMPQEGMPNVSAAQYAKMKEDVNYKETNQTMGPLNFTLPTIQAKNTRSKWRRVFNMVKNRNASPHSANTGANKRDLKKE